MSQPFHFSQGTVITASSAPAAASGWQREDDSSLLSQESMSTERPSTEQQEHHAQGDTTRTVAAHDSPQAVIARIEEHVACIIDLLDNKVSPIFLSSDSLTRKFTLSQSRSLTSIVMVLSYCHSLLLGGRTTTTREVYYFFVTHFRNQRECDAAILDAANLLSVPRSSLGLYASPKGWFCGCLEIVTKDGTTVTDATAVPSVQGLPITREWIDGNDTFDISSQDAKCIVVIEKEGVYNRLCEDRFFERHYPSILVTGKGFPDLASRAMVHRLEQELNLPVYGLADCNPFGLGVLHTYQRGSDRMGVDGGDRYSVELKWIGLKPSQMQEDLEGRLPRDVYQRLTDVDERRLEKFCEETHPFHNNHRDGEERLEEVELMQSNGYKVELEAMHWLGMDHMSDWLEAVLLAEEERHEEEQQERLDDEDSDL